MHTLNPARILSLVALLALASCGNGDAGAGQSAAGAASAPAVSEDASAPSSSSSSEDQLEVTVDGTPFAGTYRVRGDLTCMMYGGTWQAVYEDMDASGLSGIIVQLKEIPAAGGSTDKLTFTVTFGQMDDMSGTAGMLDLVGSEFGGDARATITREGDGATMRVEGTPQQGGTMSAVLRCAEVELMR